MGLTRTNCCNNWICNDEHTYKLNTFSLHSCMRNHSKYTICALHYSNNHKGEWKKCQKCIGEYDKNVYNDRCTNKYNFETNNAVKKEKIFCCNCGFASLELSDFLGCVPNDEINYYFCRKPACKRKSELPDTNNGKKTAFMFQFRRFWPKENDQRNLAMARSINNCATSLPPSMFGPYFEIDELTKQATKMLKKVFCYLLEKIGTYI